MSSHIGSVKTAWGARAAGGCVLERRGQARLEHVGFAHTDAEYKFLVEGARVKMAGGQGELDSQRVLEKIGENPVSYRRLARGLADFSAPIFG